MEVTIFKQDTPCLEFESHDCEIYFLRHALSKANQSNKNYVDVPLSSEGIEQAKKLYGHFDLVFCSPLRRTKETLHYSNITYDNLIIEHNIREMVQDKTSCLLLENYKGEENINNFWRRTSQFTTDLQNYCAKLSTKNTTPNSDNGTADIASNPNSDDGTANIASNPNSDIASNPQILIVSHGFLFNGWYRMGVFNAPPNAKLIRLK